jgi:hypothetical protein
MDPCVRCLAAPSVEGGLCRLCIRVLASLACEAFDNVRMVDPGLPERLLLDAVEAWVGSQHERHGYALVMGCPFCVPV